MNYRQEIDGLRGLAVLPVIAFHAGFPGFTGGFVGVDIFFVVSGYLITAIILEELATERFSLKTFYERRARRLLPALVAMVLCCLPAALLWMTPTELVAFARSVIAVSIFSSNFLFWSESGYFEDVAGEQPLLHTWSLAVEEQFYLGFPLLMLLLWRFLRPHKGLLIALIACTSLAICEVFSHAYPSAAFYLAPARAWELLAGSLCALYLSSASARPNGPLAAFGFCLIACSIALLSEQTRFPSLLAVPVVLGTALVILYGHRGTVVQKLLASPVLVGVGLISYSAYLWHQPLFAFARLQTLGEPSSIAMLGLCALTLLIGTLSWRYVELPFRHRRFRHSEHNSGIRQIGSQRALSTAGGALCMLFLFGFIGTGDLAERYSRYPMEPDFEWRAKVRTDECLLRAPGVTEHAPGCYERGRYNLLLWGDSHAASLYPGLRRLQTEADFAVTQLTNAGCPPLLHVEQAPYRPDCNQLNARVLDHLGETHFDRIVLHAAWEHHTYPMTREALARSLNETLAVLRSRIAADTEILLIGPVPRWRDSAYKTYVLQESALTPGKDGGLFSGAIVLREVDELLRQTSATQGVDFVSALDVFCHETRPLCRVALSPGVDSLVAVDYGHLSELGAAYFANQIRKAVLDDQNWNQYSDSPPQVPFPAMTLSTEPTNRSQRVALQHGTGAVRQQSNPNDV